MFTHLTGKRLLVVTLAVIGLLAMTAQGYAFKEPGGGSSTTQITGPAIQGVFTATPTGMPLEASVVFSGNCKKNPISFARVITGLPKSFTSLTAADIENTRIQNISIQNLCFGTTQGNLILSAVTNFNNDGIVLGGDASIYLEEPRK